MTRGARRAIAGLAVGAVLLAAHALVGQQPTTGLMVAAFAGPEPLGRKAATVLHLQVWQTLRMAAPGTAGQTLGRGIVYWHEGGAPTTHAEALSLLRGLDAQSVLWGHAFPFGDGIVIQAYLSVAAPRAGDAGAAPFWRLTLPELDGAEGTIAVSLPASAFEFAPIVLKREVIPLLDTPEGLPIFADRAFTRRIGELGPDFRALEQGRDMARIRSGGVTGWVRLPGLSANRSEVTDFAGGLIRMQRRDWVGALELFTRVTRTPNTPVNVRVASDLLMAAASRFQHERDGSPDRSLEHVAAAERLNPYLRETIRYKCMALLARPRTAVTIRQLDETVRESEYLFPENDPWLGKVKAVVARRRQTPG